MEFSEWENLDGDDDDFDFGSYCALLNFVELAVYLNVDAYANSFVQIISREGCSSIRLPAKIWTCNLMQKSFDKFVTSVFISEARLCL